MRSVATLSDQRQAQQLSTLLNSQGIDNRVEISLDRDWGSEGYGTMQCDVWVLDEDQLAAARQWVEKWQHPTDTSPPMEHSPQEKAMSTPPVPAPPRQPMGFITFYLLSICIALFAVGEFTAPAVTYPLPNLPATALISPPSKKVLLYDYPTTYDLTDELVATYGLSALRTPSTLPPKGKALFTEVYQTPWWQGVYPMLIDYAHHNSLAEENSGPLAEKIRQGQLWRLLSPIFLHGDFFHLLFNMLWLITLGRQLEQRLGVSRYLVFICIVGILSNTAQYLMSGPNFIGFSGVLCGMLTFIWQRQKRAAWESYQLDTSTLNMLLLFVGAMAALQLLSFITEVTTGYSFSPGLANTAHLAGAAVGYALARVPWFSLRV